ncbi:MAG: hypothetical protein WBQ08_19465 [Candidatus Sulfotelmatobacter sp.]
MKAVLVILVLAALASAQDNRPRVFLQANSHGNTWNARRDQSIEMAKDFQKHCPDVRISLAQNNADYTVILNHIEVGFSRDNQMEVANRSGDLLATREKGGIKGGVKEVCSIILADWQKPQTPQAADPAQQGQQAQPPQDSQQGQDQAATQQQAEPQTIQLGETADQVRTALGQPDKVVNLGTKQIYVYKDLKITFVSERVSDVQ